MVYFHPTNNIVSKVPRLRALESWRSWVSLEWALPGVVVGVVMPLSVSVGNALELLISDVVVSVSVWSWSVDALLAGNEVRWLVHEHSLGGGDQSSSENDFHFYLIINSLVIYG